MSNSITTYDYNLIKLTHTASVQHSAQVTDLQNAVKNGAHILQVKYVETVTENLNKVPPVAALHEGMKITVKKKRTYDAYGNVIYLPL